jgi:hypothetical protein
LKDKHEANSVPHTNNPIWWMLKISGANMMGVQKDPGTGFLENKHVTVLNIKSQVLFLTLNVVVNQNKNVNPTPYME